MSSSNYLRDGLQADKEQVVAVYELVDEVLHVFPRFFDNDQWPFYAVLNIHPRVAQMSMGHGSFDSTMKYYTGVPADLQKRAAEALGELLFGPQNAPAGDHTPATPPSNPEDLAMLRAELQQKLLQIEELEARARQDPDI